MAFSPCWSLQVWPVGDKIDPLIWLCYVLRSRLINSWPPARVVELVYFLGTQGVHDMFGVFWQVFIKTVPARVKRFKVLKLMITFVLSIGELFRNTCMRTKGSDKALSPIIRCYEILRKLYFDSFVIQRTNIDRKT